MVGVTLSVHVTVTVTRDLRTSRAGRTGFTSPCPAGPPHPLQRNVTRHGHAVTAVGECGTDPEKSCMAVSATYLPVAHRARGATKAFRRPESRRDWSRDSTSSVTRDESRRLGRVSRVVWGSRAAGSYGVGAALAAAAALLALAGLLGAARSWPQTPGPSRHRWRSRAGCCRRLGAASAVLPEHALPRNSASLSPE